MKFVKGNRVLVGKHKGKYHLGWPRYRQNIKNDLKQTIWEGIDWIHLVQDRAQQLSLVNTNELPGSIKFWDFLTR